MEPGNVIALVLGVMSIIVIPSLVFVVRSTSRWTRMEGNLSSLTKDVRDLMVDKDRVHAAMFDTMREDRSVTDRRLRWLEENVWNVPKHRRDAA